MTSVLNEGKSTGLEVLSSRVILLAGVQHVTCSGSDCLRCYDVQHTLDNERGVSTCTPNGQTVFSLVVLNVVTSV